MNSTATGAPWRSASRNAIPSWSSSSTSGTGRGLREIERRRACSLVSARRPSVACQNVTAPAVHTASDATTVRNHISSGRDLSYSAEEPCHEHHRPEYDGQREQRRQAVVRDPWFEVDCPATGDADRARREKHRREREAARDVHPEAGAVHSRVRGAGGR